MALRFKFKTKDEIPAEHLPLLPHRRLDEPDDVDVPKLEHALRRRAALPRRPLKCAVERRGTPVGESVKPTRQLSLQPVATEASVEAMKHSKPSV